MSAVTACNEQAEQGLAVVQTVAAPYSLKGSTCHLLLKILESTPLEEVKMLHPHIVK